MSEYHVIIFFEIHLTLFFKKLFHQAERLLTEDGKISEKNVTGINEGVETWK